ncbi:MAG: hypothetical protein HONBIEJF_00878 [Fimbriimonadaceae bacterium]|nr:hypothetical protein [Fimbriimonadaceae bacterium]
MRTLTLVLFALLVLIGCGGGGGGGGTDTGGGGSRLLVGRVLWVPTGAPTNPESTVQVGTATAQTNLDDGSFEIAAPETATEIVVVWRATPNSSPVVFTFPVAAGSDTTDLGDLWIGPETTTVTGRVLSTADNVPIADAEVSFGGRSTKTGIDGTWTLTNIAYSSTDLASFLGIQGKVSKAGFNATTFFPVQGAIGGVVTIPDILMSPESDPDPPPSPFNIWGTVSPSEFASGTIVQLLENGVPIRQFTVGADGKYAFWIVAGNYVIRANNPGNGKTAADQSVTLPSSDTVIRKDVALQ